MSELTFRYREQPQFKYLMDKRWRETEEQNPGALPLGEKQDILTAVNVMADASRITLPELLRRCRHSQDSEYILKSLYPDPSSRQVSLLSAFPRTSNVEWNNCDAEWSAPSSELEVNAERKVPFPQQSLETSSSDDIESAVDELMRDPDIELLLSGKYGDDLSIDHRRESVKNIRGEDLSKFEEKSEEVV